VTERFGNRYQHRFYVWEMVDVEGQLLREIADSRMKRKDVALTFRYSTGAAARRVDRLCRCEPGDH